MEIIIIIGTLFIIFFFSWLLLIIRRRLEEKQKEEFPKEFPKQIKKQKEEFPKQKDRKEEDEEDLTYMNYKNRVLSKLFLCRTTANIKYISYLYRKFKTYTSNTSTLLNHMIENIKYCTEEEDIVYTYLYNKGIIFIPQCPCLGYLLDCYIPKYHINIEIDGGYHKEQKEKDWKRSRDIFKAFKIKTYRITNKQVQYDYFEQIIDNIITKSDK